MLHCSEPSDKATDEVMCLIYMIYCWYVAV